MPSWSMSLIIEPYHLSLSLIIRPPPWAKSAHRRSSRSRSSRRSSMRCSYLTTVARLCPPSFLYEKRQTCWPCGLPANPCQSTANSVARRAKLTVMTGRSSGSAAAARSEHRAEKQRRCSPAGTLWLPDKRTSREVRSGSFRSVAALPTRARTSATPAQPDGRGRFGQRQPNAVDSAGIASEAHLTVRTSHDHLASTSCSDGMQTG